LFRYDCDFDFSPAALEAVPFAMQLQLKEKAAAVLAQLCCVCGTTLSSEPSLLEATITRVSAMIARTLAPGVPALMVSPAAASPATQMMLLRGGGNSNGSGSHPVTSTRQSLQNQRACLREALVAISEGMFLSSTAVGSVTASSLIVLSLQDVVGTWQALAPAGPGPPGPQSIFHSPSAILDACLRSAAADASAAAGGSSSTTTTGGTGGGGASEEPLDSVGAAKDALGVILSSARRVTHQPLPEETWVCAQDHPTHPPVADPAAALAAALDRALPFAAVWQVRPEPFSAAVSLPSSVAPWQMPPGCALSRLFTPRTSLSRRALSLSPCPTRPCCRASAWPHSPCTPSGRPPRA